MNPPDLDTTESTRRRFHAARPFPHVVVDGFLPEEVARLVRRETGGVKRPGLLHARISLSSTWHTCANKRRPFTPPSPSPQQDSIRTVRVPNLEMS